VTGVEIKVRDYERVGHTIHLNIFELNRRQFSEVVQVASKTRNIEQVIDYLTAEKLPYSYNHPFWFEPGDTPNFEIIPSLFDLFPVVEYNMQRIRRKNLLTLKLAEKHGCGVLSTTDSHTGEIAKAFTLAQGESFGEFFANICQGNFFLVAHDLTVSVMTGQMVSWLDSLFHPEDALDGKVFKTGYRQLDRLLDSVLAGALDEKPISYRFARILAWAISRTRIPAFLYLLSQDRLARDFVQRMENNRPLFGIDHP
jgi:hypothetical protein